MYTNITDMEQALTVIDQDSHFASKKDCDAPCLTGEQRHFSAKVRQNAWLRNNAFRKKQKSKFYSLNPAMDRQRLNPLCSLNIIYINDHATMVGQYPINHVNHLYITPRGYIEQFRGDVEWTPGGSCFGVGRKDHTKGRVTNRMIRKLTIAGDAELQKLSYYRKMYRSDQYGIL